MWRARINHRVRKFFDMDEPAREHTRGAAQAASSPNLIDAKAVARAQDHIADIRQQYLGGGAQSQQLQRALEQSVKAYVSMLNFIIPSLVLTYSSIDSVCD